MYVLLRFNNTFPVGHTSRLPSFSILSMLTHLHHNKPKGLRPKIPVYGPQGLYIVTVQPIGTLLSMLVEQNGIASLTVCCRGNTAEMF